MKQDDDKKSKLKRFAAKSFAKLKRSPLLKRKFIKVLLPIVLLSMSPKKLGAPSSVNVSINDGELRFRPSLFYDKMTSSQSDNIVKAFKEGRAKNITEFLKLYEPYFKYDTIKFSKDSMRSKICLGQYINHKDIVEIKYFVPDTTGASPQEAAAIIRFCEKFNSAELKIPVKAHECSHKGFHNNGGIKKIIYMKNIANPDYLEVRPPYKLKPKVSVCNIGLRDMATLNQWNEIGGDLGYLIAERELYLETRDPSVFTYKTKYTEAVKNGTINPFDVYARPQEYAFLINSTIEWWMAVKKNGYAHTSLKDVKTMVDASKKYDFMLASSSVPSALQKRVSTCLTLPIDGKLVNFFNYVTEDNKKLTPQPMVENYIAEIEKVYPLYQHNDAPFSKMAAILLQKQKFFQNSTASNFLENTPLASEQRHAPSSESNNSAIFTLSAYNKSNGR